MKIRTLFLTILVLGLFAGNAFAVQTLLDVRTSFDGDNADLLWTAGGGLPGAVYNDASGPQAKKLYFTGDWLQNVSGSIVGYKSDLKIDLGMHTTTEKHFGATAVNVLYESPATTSSWAAYVTVVLNTSFSGTVSDVFGFNDDSNVVFQESLSSGNELVFGLLDVATDADNANNIYNLFQIWVKSESGSNYIIESLLFSAYSDGTLGEEDEVIELHGLEYNPAATPIPGAAWLLGSGLVALVGLRRRFK